MKNLKKPAMMRITIVRNTRLSRPGLGVSINKNTMMD
jgi:hypothetical protein